MFYILVFAVSLYVLVIGVIILGFVKQKSKSNLIENENQRGISIIIPIRNESDCIIQCLNSIKNLKYSREHFEVIIVNDHSTDNSVELITEFISQSLEFDIVLLNLVNEQSKKYALKLGIEKAKYEFIAITDADCVLPEFWLSNINSEIEFCNSDMIIGPVMQNEKPDFFSSFQILEMLALQGVGFGCIGIKTPILNNAANLSFSKKKFNDLGGYDSFNTPSGDDVFLLEKFNQANLSISGILREDYIVETKLEPTLKELVNQKVRWSSKFKFYKNPFTILIGIITISAYIAIILVYMSLILVENYKIELVFLLICKWLIDFILLFLVASFYKRKKALYYFIPVQLIYPLYSLLIWIISMVASYNWKGRKING